MLDEADSSREQEQPRYTYLPLSGSKSRLVSIRTPQQGHPISCDIYNSDLDCVYYALSYVCGNQSNRVPIRLNGLAFDVGSNLSVFLEYASVNFANTPLWIDELCINQTDIKERSAQVQQIGEVYRSAQHVIAWLGRAGYPGNMLFGEVQRSLDLLKDNEGAESGDRYSAYVRQLKNDRAKAVASAIQSFCDLHYFSRLWVYQEFIIAKEVLVVRGDHQIHASQLFPFLYDAVYEVAASRINHTALNNEVLYHVRASRGGMILRHLREHTVTRDLDEILTDSFDGECAEWRDRIFGLLSCCAQRSHIAVNYNDTAEDLVIKLLKACEHGGIEKSFQVMAELYRIYAKYEVKHSVRGSFLSKSLRKTFERCTELAPLLFLKRSPVTRKNRRHAATQSKPDIAITCTFCHQTWVGHLGKPLWLFCSAEKRANRVHAIFYSSDISSLRTKVIVVERDQFKSVNTKSALNRLPLRPATFGGARHVCRRIVDRTLKMVTSRVVVLSLAGLGYTVWLPVAFAIAMAFSPFLVIYFVAKYTYKAGKWASHIFR